MPPPPSKKKKKKKYENLVKISYYYSLFKICQYAIVQTNYVECGNTV